MCIRDRCTDDRNPWEIAHEGHINALIYRLINQHNIPAHVAYRVASWSAARHFGLKRLGLIAPGKRADIVLLSDVQQVVIQQVIVAVSYTHLQTAGQTANTTTADASSQAVPESGQGKLITVKTDVLSLTINTRGGDIEQANLLAVSYTHLQASGDRRRSTAAYECANRRRQHRS